MMMKMESTKKYFLQLMEQNLNSFYGHALAKVKNGEGQENKISSF